MKNNLKLIHFYNDEHGAYLLYNLSTDTEEQNNLADIDVKTRDKLINKLDSSLIEMRVEMPILNVEFTPDSKTERMHLKFTKELAEKECALFKLWLAK